MTRKTIILLLALALSGAALAASAAQSEPELQTPVDDDPEGRPPQAGIPPPVPDDGADTPKGTDEEPPDGEADDDAAGSSDTVLFHWAGGPDAGTRGALYAGLGLAGALVTMFSLIGGAIPGTAGKAKIDAEEQRLETFYSRLTDLANEPVVDGDAVRALNDTVDKLRDDLRRESWKLFGLGFLLYVLLGAFFATALARDYLQALVIGAGWTGYIGALGLKSDFAERKRIKDASLERAQEVVAAVGRGGHAPDSPTAAGSGGFEPETLVRIEEEIRTARAV